MSQAGFEASVILTAAMGRAMNQTTLAEGMDSIGDRRPGLVWALTVVHSRDGARIGTCVRAGATVALGRESDLFGTSLFDDGRVSRRHAEVRAEGAGLELFDRGSRNGTYVNGTRVERQALADGDIIGLGTVLLLCHRVPADFAAVDGGGLLGVGPAHRELIRAIEAVAARDTPVLIEGESGSGRDRTAEELHRRSGRAGPFVPVHCGVLSAGRPREELFGAGGQDAGVIGRARGGTLYLDGIDDASEEVQLSLLRFLEGDEDSGVRVVAAARDGLSGRVERGGLRGDFVARLGRYAIEVPPLRARIEDVAVLARRFIETFAGQPLALSPTLALRLLRHAWPGNVRELQAVIERAVIDAGDGERISTSPAVEDLLARDPSEAAREAFELSSRDEARVALRVERTGLWFEVAGGERVDLENRRALPRLLAALVEAREARSSLTVPDLVERGWPGERILEEAGINRVHVALTTMRKLGLRDFIVRNRAGYCLDPDAAIELAS